MYENISQAVTWQNVIILYFVLSWTRLWRQWACPRKNATKKPHLLLSGFPLDVWENIQVTRVISIVFLEYMLMSHRKYNRFLWHTVCLCKTENKGFFSKYVTSHFDYMKIYSNNFPLPNFLHIWNWWLHLIKISELYQIKYLSSCTFGSWCLRILQK